MRFSLNTYSFLYPNEKKKGNKVKARPASSENDDAEDNELCKICYGKYRNNIRLIKKAKKCNC